MKEKSFAVIGGDLRSIMLADLLVSKGYTVEIIGFSNLEYETLLTENPNMQAVIEKADIIIGPMPCSNDNESLNTPFHSERIWVNDVFKLMNNNQLFLAGHISDKIIHLSQVYDIHTIDYLKREELAVLNAVPTAEGAIQIAFEELSITLNSSNVLVLGFGRIGRLLAHMLHGIGAEVTVSARKHCDLAWIKSSGFKSIHTNKIDACLASMDVIFNTIPHIILDKRRLLQVRKDTLLIDLASKPGGIDIDAAKNIGLKTIWALSLPGKVAPLSAAQAILETITNILDEMEV